MNEDHPTITEAIEMFAEWLGNCIIRIPDHIVPMKYIEFGCHDDCEDVDVHVFEERISGRRVLALHSMAFHRAVAPECDEDDE